MRQVVLTTYMLLAFAVPINVSASFQQIVEAEAKEIIGQDKDIFVWAGVVSPDADHKMSQKIYGIGDKGKDGIVRIGSLTQGVTAMMLARLIEKGLIKGENAVQNYVPDGVWLPTFNGRQITFADLATHTSGLPDLPPELRFIDQYKTYSRKEFFDYLNTVKLSYMPGEKVKFSRMGYALLSLAIEEIVKKSWSEIFDQEIKNKLDLVNTNVSLSKFQKRKFLTGHGVEGEKIDSLELFSLDSPFIGSQGLFSDLNDLMKWTEYLLGQGGTDLNFLLPIMLDTCRKIEKDQDFCFGFKFIDEQEENMYFLQSRQFGFGVYVGFIPKEKIGIVIMTNKSVLLEKMGIKLLKLLKKEKTS